MAAIGRAFTVLGCSEFLLTPKRVELVGREVVVGVGPGRLGGERI